MTENAKNKEPPESWASALAGAILFLNFGLFLILSEIPHRWAVLAWLSYFHWLFAVLIVLPAVGFGLGWIKDFPRWSMPYIGLMILMARYLEDASTPGLRIFNYDIFGRELWGWRAWIPTLTATVIALLVSHSLGPVIRLFGNIWRDWTLLSFGMFGLMPLFIAVEFDEMDRLFSLPFMVILTGLMVGTSIIYLRTPRRRCRGLTLLIGTTFIAAIGVITPTLYWWGVDRGKIQEAVMQTTMIVSIMVSPWLIELLRRLIGYVQPLRPNGSLYG